MLNIIIKFNWIHPERQYSFKTVKTISDVDFLLHLNASWVSAAHLTDNKS